MVQTFLRQVPINVVVSFHPVEFVVSRNVLQMKILTFFVGVFLLPVCFAVSETAVSLIRAITPSLSATIPASVWALGGGFLFWIFLYFTVPMPVRTYVLAHELTHALWGAMMGARIFRMRVSKDTGSVTMSKSNFLITLAPYFFPLYTVIVISGYYILSVFYDVHEYQLFWLGLVGFTWGFHFTFTISTLLQHQSDIKEYGAVFSYVLIYLLNVVGICIWILIVSDVTIEQMIRFFWAHMMETAASVRFFGLLAIEKIRETIQ